MCPQQGSARGGCDGGYLLGCDLDAEPGAATTATTGKYLTSAAGRHAGTKAVRALTANVVRLVCTLHSESPSVVIDAASYQYLTVNQPSVESNLLT